MTDARRRLVQLRDRSQMALCAMLANNAVKRLSPEAIAELRSVITLAIMEAELIGEWVVDNRLSRPRYIDPQHSWDDETTETDPGKGVTTVYRHRPKR